MKVLVTGGCGFIGSHVCEFYRGLGWDVISVDSMTKYELSRTGYSAELARSYNWDFLKGLGVDLRKEDIRDFDSFLRSADCCDYIVHTAAQPAMTLSVEDPLLDLSTNVVGSFNVFEAARRLNIPVVSCSSIHVYGTDINKTLQEAPTRYTRIPAEIDENHPTMTGTITPLHASKKSMENYVSAYIDTYGVKAACFRLTGLYGPRQFGGEDHGWVANFSIRAIQKRPITLFGNGKQIRDILYATDVCTAFHAFFQNPVPGIYNIGAGEQNAISLLECIHYLEELTGEKVNYTLGGERLGDLYYFMSDTAKAHRNLGWKAQIQPRDGIRMLFEWINENRRIFH